MVETPEEIGGEPSIDGGSGGYVGKDRKSGEIMDMAVETRGRTGAELCQSEPIPH